MDSNITLNIEKAKTDGAIATCGAVCHEVNQHLQAIEGYATLIKLHMQGQNNNDKEIDKLLEKIRASNFRIADFTDKLRKVKKCETVKVGGNCYILDVDKSSK